MSGKTRVEKTRGNKGKEFEIKAESREVKECLKRKRKGNHGKASGESR